MEDRRVFWTWLFSYLLVLILPLSWILVLSGLVQTRARELIVRSQHAMLQQLAQNVDARVREFDTLSIQIAQNELAQAAMRISSPDAKPDYYNLYELVQQLREYAALNDSIDDLYIYLPGSDRYVGSPGHLTRFYFTSLALGDMQPINDSWDRVLEQPPKRGFVPVQDRRSGGRRLVYTCDLSTLGIARHEGILFILMKLELPALWSEQDATATARATSATEEATGQLLLFDQSQQLLLHTGDGQDDQTHDVELIRTALWPQAKPSVDNEPLSVVAHDRQKWVLDAVISRTTPLIYVRFEREAAYWAPMRGTRLLMLVSVLAIAMLTVLASYYMTRWRYSPVDRLLRLVNRGNVAREGMDVFARTEHYVTELVERNAEIVGALEKGLEKQRQDLLRGLSQRFERERPDRLSRRAGTRSRALYASFCLILIEFVDLSSNPGLMQFVLGNVLTELLEHSDVAYSFQIDDLTACLVNGEDTQHSQLGDRVAQAVDETSRVLETYFEMPLLTVQSEPFSDLGEAERATSNLLAAA